MSIDLLTWYEFIADVVVYQEEFIFPSDSEFEDISVIVLQDIIMLI